MITRLDPIGPPVCFPDDFYFLSIDESGHAVVLAQPTGERLCIEEA